MTEWKIVFCPGSLGRGKAAAKVAKKGPVAMKHNARDACKAEARAAWAEREQRYRPSSKNEAERTRGQSDRRGKESVANASGVEVSHHDGCFLSLARSCSLCSCCILVSPFGASSAA